MTFISGLFVGAMIGVAILVILTSAKQADKYMRGGETSDGRSETPQTGREHRAE
ncbi:hypothetical protein H7B67_01460 [Cohnella thailandensis]|uniref:DUF3789 domain-containing protein n=1 Tax=Cohnella thailandensis TaxID=557557 RepID=A0A841SJU5_9BACL|nr:hypothetical protein [Cohnella thailandensis]